MKICVSYELGSFYFLDECYEDVFNVLFVLLMVLVVFVEDIELEVWEVYEKNKSNLFYGKYCFGQFVVESGDYI